MGDFRFGHRLMLFSFLGDTSLTVQQRMIGTVVILRCSQKSKFSSNWQMVPWGKISALSGYTPAECQSAVSTLVEKQWLGLAWRGDGKIRFFVPEDRIRTARERALEHSQNQRERAAA